MIKTKTYYTKYGTFYDTLNADDIKFFEMTDEEFDQRSNRLANKTLNGIRDAEVIEATARWYRNKELFYGKTTAKLMKKEWDNMFKTNK